MSKLYKKEEDSLLNKKKKREETKQKNKLEKTKPNKNVNNINQYNNYMALYMNQMQPINNQAYLEGCPNLYYYNGMNPPYQYPPQMMGYSPIFPSYFVEQPKCLEDCINNIYQRGIVNNIIGAFFIKESQEKQKNREKRKIPIATVELGEPQGDESTKNNIDINNMNNNENMDDNMKENEIKKNENNELEEKGRKLENEKNEEENEANEQGKSSTVKNELIRPNIVD